MFARRSIVRDFASIFVVFAFLFGMTWRTCAEEPPRESISSRGWLPKAETGALRFLDEHPDYDGRGVTVAIFDTGVDPGVDGLRTTPDGRPKIVDVVDGSGSGDVDTSVVRGAEDGKLLGRSGRSLTISSKWKNPSGKFHVGWKRGYELFPRDLISRVRAARRKQWDERQRKLQAETHKQLTEFDEAHPKPDAEQKQRRAELARRVELLQKLQTQYDDPGPIYDCVVFHDGKRWQAVIDTDEDGDLRDERVMTNYRDRRQYGTFDDVSLLNFAVNIYDQGRLLSIVTDCGTHGTHVAGIVAAYYPEHPERNGLAPGAQIVSVKIGDARLGSSSTGVGQIRGLTAVLRNRCDLINMSYGGSTGFPNQGRLLERYAEVVQEHGVLFVASAGNNGPALSTVGSPGGTSSALLGVGAYVSPDLMRYAYAQRSVRGEQAFTWTSRGPTADGDLGVDICAPGGAISPVSRWSIQHRRLANGTSMSAPNACGNIALLMSGLKAEQIDYSPSSVRRAIVNTARPLEPMDPFAHGPGMIQVDRAFRYARDNAERDDQARFEIRVSDRDDARGIYFRDGDETSRPQVIDVRVRPRLADRDADDGRRADVDLAIRLQPTVDWIEAPEQLVMSYGGKSFELRVDPSQLPPGAHFGEVQGFNLDAPELGPLFRVPVTVIRAHANGREYEASVTLEAGAESRHFLKPPRGATWVDVALTANLDNEDAKRFALHALQLAPHRGYGRGYQREYITLQPGESVLRSFPVRDDLTLELCLTQYWSSLDGENDVTLQARFQGLSPQPAVLTFSSERPAVRMDVVADCGDQWLQPEARVTSLRRSIAPASFEVGLSDAGRDDLPRSRRVYESITTYELTLKQKRTVRPRASFTQTPGFSSGWESRLWQIFDENKRLVASGTGGEASLEKGSYVLRMHLRHEDPEQLTRWRRAPLWLEMPLEKPLALGRHASPSTALDGKPSFGVRRLLQSQRAVVYFTAPKIPSFAEAGDVLLGTFTLGSKDRAVASAGQRPGGYPLRITVERKPETMTDPLAKAPAIAAETTSQPETESEEDFWLLARRDRLAELRVAGKREAHAELVEQILDDHPKDLPTLIERLRMLDDDDRKQRLPAVVAAADAVIRRVPKKRLAQQLALRVNEEDPRSAAKRKEIEQQREILTDALYRKGRAIAYMDLPPTPGAEPMEIPKKPKTYKARNKLFEQNYAELRKWVDMTDPKYVLLNIRRERRRERPAAALLLLLDLMKKQPTRQLLYKKRGDILGELGWKHWQAYANAWKIIRFPDAYPPL